MWGAHTHKGSYCCKRNGNDWAIPLSLVIAAWRGRMEKSLKLSELKIHAMIPPESEQMGGISCSHESTFSSEHPMDWLATMRLRWSRHYTDLDTKLFITFSREVKHHSTHNALLDFLRRRLMNRQQVKITWRRQWSSQKQVVYFLLFFFSFYSL